MTRNDGKHSFALDENGKALLRITGAELPTVQLDPAEASENKDISFTVTTFEQQNFSATDPLSQYFTASVDSIAAKFASEPAYQKQWLNFSLQNKKPVAVVN